MTDCDSVNNFSCNDVTDAQLSDCSATDSDESQNATFPRQGGLRPAGSLPGFVPFSVWKPERSYQGSQALRYSVEWRLFVKNRERAGQSELDIVLSPKDFWKHVLRPKLNEESANKPWKEGVTLFVLLVNDRTVEGELQVAVFYLTLLVNRGVHLWLVWLYNAALVVRWYCQKQRLSIRHQLERQR